MTAGSRLAAAGPWLLAAGLAVTAVGAFGMGLWRAWACNGDGDMQLRVREYAAFRAGDYPNPPVDKPAAGRKAPFTIYPPYAFPMFAVFFEPGGLIQGRIVIELLTVAAVVLMGFYGRDRLKPFGPAWATVGALAGVGMASNGTTLALGQFSTMCAGLLVLQLMLLERGRAAAAGCAWAAAMIKPHIAVASAVLFLVNRLTRGLVVGVAVLALLSAAALWWTETSPAALAHHWLFQVKLRFASGSPAFGPAHLAEGLGWDQRLTQTAALGILAIVAVAVVACVRLPRREVATLDLLPLAAIGAVLGRVLIYHRHYDNVMLFPLLIACLALALAAPTAANVATAVAVGLTLYIPQRVHEWVPFVQFILPAIWIVAALRVAVVAVAPPHRAKNERDIRTVSA